jgi:hypothetical protein
MNYFLIKKTGNHTLTPGYSKMPDEIDCTTPYRVVVVMRVVPPIAEEIEALAIIWSREKIIGDQNGAKLMNNIKENKTNGINLLKNQWFYLIVLIFYHISPGLLNEF